MKYALSFIILLFFIPAAFAQPCLIDDFNCIRSDIMENAKKIENVTWRDQTYRELAKTLAASGSTDIAFVVIDSIETPDTKALALRGVAMEVATKNYPPETHQAFFQELHAKAKTIDHPPSFAIALTYIAIAQAVAGDNEGAWKTAASMENDALRHKAYGETAEIQAELGKYDAAMKSIGFIETASFRNKAYSVVSKILADQNHLQDALNAASNITNPYKKASALQYILNVQDKIIAEKLDD